MFACSDRLQSPKDYLLPLFHLIWTYGQGSGWVGGVLGGGGETYGKITELIFYNVRSLYPAHAFPSIKRAEKPVMFKSKKGNIV